LSTTTIPTSRAFTTISCENNPARHRPSSRQDIEWF
jgi:hypothetical protein